MSIELKAKEGMEFNYRGQPYVITEVNHTTRMVYGENYYARHQLFGFSEDQLKEHTNVRIL